MKAADRRNQLDTARATLDQAMRDVIVLTACSEILGGATVAAGHVKKCDRADAVARRLNDARLALHKFEVAARA